MQQVNLYQPIAADRQGPAPIVLRVAVTPQAVMTSGGPTSSTQRVENYILFSALPEELQRRVELAVQLLMAGG